jgi:D-alanyl-D-alanine carboxypeptidase/D-alanyl-D-alanine-endopeptidase (penicillin-binding protein 4)
MRSFVFLIVASLLATQTTANAQNPTPLPDAGAAASHDASHETGEPVDELSQKLDKLLSHKRLAKAEVGVHIVDLDTGTTVYAENEEAQLNPASNIKLITAAAVLDYHGTAHTFRTELLGAREGKTIPKNLYLRGDGDPFLHWTHLLEMAERLRRKGIREVAGDLVVDDTAFDNEFLPPAFDQRSEEAPYRATTSAVSVSFSAMTVIIRPGKIGEKPRVSFDPPNDYALVVNTATTVKSKKEAKAKPLAVRIKPWKGRTRLILSGGVRAGGGATLRKRVHGPSLYAGHLMKSALASLGIKVTGTVRRGETPKGATLLAGHTSHSTPLLVGLMQKYSNNFMAEMFFKSLDRGKTPATWAGATEKLKNFLDKAGLDRGKYRFSNGSGLYDANTMSARQLTTVLTYMYGRADIWPEYLASFAAAGVDGTLRKRMKDTEAEGTARGKTGTLHDVSALSGYVTTTSGRRLAYAILFNGTSGGAWTFRQIQDKIVATIATQ